jgi:hypothetical protein
VSAEAPGKIKCRTGTITREVSAPPKCEVEDPKINAAQSATGSQDEISFRKRDPI